MEKMYFYDFLIKVQSIAKTGLVYSKDPYALDNYRDISNLTKKMLEEFQNIKFDRNNYFTKNVYPTPNISVRTVVTNSENKVLLVKEAIDGGYSLPGGWCDLYESASETARKEILQEAGVIVDNVKLVGLIHQVPFKHNVTVPAFVAVFKADFKAIVQKPCYEILEIGFFDINKLPPLSFKGSKEEIERMIHATINNEIIFD